jgi:hypothetical protein
VRSGSWIDGIRFTYGSTPAPWRGNGNGGGAKPAFTLANDEWITQAWVRSGAYVDEIRFYTTKGRYWSTSGDTTQSGDIGALASPCPAGAYRWVGRAQGMLVLIAALHKPCPGMVVLDVLSY